MSSRGIDVPTFRLPARVATNALEQYYKLRSLYWYVAGIGLVKGAQLGLTWCRELQSLSAVSQFLLSGAPKDTRSSLFLDWHRRFFEGWIQKPPSQFIEQGILRCPPSGEWKVSTFLQNYDIGDMAAHDFRNGHSQNCTTTCEKGRTHIYVRTSVLLHL